MKFVCISDTHDKHKDLKVPEGDILIHSGDITIAGGLGALEIFARWFESQPHQHKILIAGNHDYCFQDHPGKARKVLQEWAANMRKIVRLIGWNSKEIGSLTEFLIWI